MNTLHNKNEFYFKNKVVVILIILYNNYIEIQQGPSPPKAFSYLTVSIFMESFSQVTCQVANTPIDVGYFHDFP